MSQHRSKPSRRALGRDTGDSEKTQPARRASSAVHPLARLLYSAVLVLHLSAVFVAPWALSTPQATYPEYDANAGPTLQMERVTPPAGPDRPSRPPERPFVGKLVDFFRPYLDITYLNHGYQFFAPNPGESHVIRYTVYDEAGAVIESGVFPDLNVHRPRLRYHRHFMLAEQSVGLAMENPQLGEASGNYLAQHLLHRHGGAKVQLECLEHRLLSPEKVLAGAEIDDPKTYRTWAAIKVSAPLRDARRAGEQLPARGGR